MAASVQLFFVPKYGTADRVWDFGCRSAWELSATLMASREIHPVYVVVGIRGNEIQYWAAAVSRRKAACEVGSVLGPEWKTIVLDWRLTPERLATLNLTPNSVRKIGIVEGLL